MSLRFEKQATCPVCETVPTETTRKYPALTVFGLGLEYAHCDECGILWQLNRLADDYLLEYYRDVYRQITAPSQSHRDQTAKVGHIRAAIQVGWLAQFIEGRKTALDYGCSGGWLMDAMTPNGLTVCGVEMDKSELTAPARARYQVYDEITDAPEVEIITMSHVVEHFNHPLENMRQIYDKLKPGGLLFVDVPNYRGLPGYGTGLHHPICYDAASLARMLGVVGFDVLEHSFYDWDNTPMDKYLMMAATKPNKRQRRK
jgi:2-polyprenyl-3-methyl-5-hydroxy-6-metoxy-1,4-benzoquinol methylase